MKISILTAACSLLPAVLFAQAFQWKTFTSTSNVVDMVESQGKIWTATSGGLSGYDLATGTFDIYTNTRGLAMNQTVAVGVDSRGFIWAGLGDARITRINPVTHDVRQVVDLQNDVFEINAILPVGEEVFVAANNGIYRFAYYRVVDDYRVFEAIKSLGNFPGETRVTSLAVANGFLYAGTVAGLARAELGQPQLNAPEAWTTFTQTNSPLPENNIITLQGYPPPNSNLLNIATAHWIASLVDSTWTRYQLPNIVDFAEGDHRWALSDTNSVSQVYKQDNLQSPWLPVGNPLPNAVKISADSVGGGTALHLGLSDSDRGSGGLVFSLNPGGEVWSTPISAPGIGGNNITALGVDPQGRVWAGGSGFTSGVYVRSGETWTNFDRSTGHQQAFFYAHPTTFAFDDYGGAWVGAMGYGVAWFRGGDNITFFNTLDSSGFANVGGVPKPRLRGIPDYPDYCENYVTRDGSGNIFISNLEAADGYALTVASSDWISRGNHSDPWTYFYPRGISLPSDFANVGRVLVDPLQHVWAGPGRNGSRLFVADLHGTLADTSDDTWTAFQPNSRKDNVTCFDSIATEVLDWAVDRQGYLWAGCITGGYYTQGGVTDDPDQTRFICVELPVGHRVNAIHVDAQDNKWFGTDNGVAVLDKNFNWVYVFQTANSVDHPSDLISNNILSITSNPSTGEVWIGTADGLSMFTSPFTGSPLGAKTLKAYPSPFRADGSQHMHLNRDAGHFDELRILTISGRLVRKLVWAQMIDSEGGVGWDGRNDNNELVAGGVYVMVASSNDGKSAVGKIAVLGR